MHFKRGWSGGGDASQYSNEKEDGCGGEDQHADPNVTLLEGEIGSKGLAILTGSYTVCLHAAARKGKA